MFMDLLNVLVSVVIILLQKKIYLMIKKNLYRWEKLQIILTLRY